MKKLLNKIKALISMEMLLLVFLFIFLFFLLRAATSKKSSNSLLEQIGKDIRHYKNEFDKGYYYEDSISIDSIK